MATPESGPGPFRASASPGSTVRTVGVDFDFDKHDFLVFDRWLHAFRATADFLERKLTTHDQRSSAVL